MDLKYVLISIGSASIGFAFGCVVAKMNLRQLLSRTLSSNTKVS